MLSFGEYFCFLPVPLNEGKYLEPMGILCRTTKCNRTYMELEQFRDMPLFYLPKLPLKRVADVTTEDNHTATTAAVDV